MSSLPPPFAPPKTEAPAASPRSRHRVRTKPATGTSTASNKDAAAAPAANGPADGNLSSTSSGSSRRGRGRGGGGAGAGPGRSRGAPSDGSLWRRGAPLPDPPAGTLVASGGGQARVPGSTRGISDFARRAGGEGQARAGEGGKDDVGKPLAPAQIVAAEVARMKSGDRAKAVLGSGATQPGPSTLPLADRLSLPGSEQAQQHQPQRTDRPIQPMPSSPSGKSRTKKLKAKPAQPSVQAIDEANDRTRAALLARIAAPAEEGPARLEHEIRNLFETQKASQRALDARQKLIDILTDHLNHSSFNWGHHHDPRRNPIRIEPFGSVRFGLATSSSDLDLCLFDPYRPTGFEEKTFRTNSKGEGLPEIYDMRRLAQRLHRLGLAKVQPIPFSNVPICKFEAIVDGELIQADLNTNERFGVINSRLLNAYCELNRLVRPLAVFIKFWAKQRGLNDPSGSEGQTSFSSYTLILLLIAFLQTRGILPNLQSEELTRAMRVPPTRFFSTPKRGMGRNRNKARITPSVGWDTTFVEGLEEHPEVWRGAEVDGDLPLRDLAKGFFEWFVGDEDGNPPGLDMNTQVVSIRSGGILPRQSEYPPAGYDQPKQNGNGLGNGPRPPLPEGAIAPEDELRQSVEDMAITAFAQQGAPGPDPLPPTPARPQDSRSSSPIAFGQFSAEPANWAARPLVVQDPFLQERNCAGNIIPDVVDTFLLEMRRALGLIDRNASIAEICKSVTLEPGFQGNLNGWRKQQANDERERVKRATARMQGMARSAKPVKEGEALFERKGDLFDFLNAQGVRAE